MTNEVTASVSNQRDSALSVADRKNKLIERRALIESLLEDRDPSVMNMVLPASVRSKLSSDQQQSVEKPVLLTAYINTIHGDDFINKTSTFRYELVSDRTRYDYYPLGADRPMLSSSRVKVSGYQIGSKIFSYADTTSLQLLSQPPVSTAIGPQKILVVPIGYQDSPPVPYTVEELKTLVFNGQVQKFYDEASYGQMSWTGDVAPRWYTITKPSRNQNGVCNFPMFGLKSDEYDDVYKLIKNDVGIKQSGLDELIVKAYQTLGLLTFLTTGEDETRAWTAHIGDSIPRASRAIHTDFEQKFIRAEVINWKELLDLGGYAQARATGKLRTIGKDYIIQDGDVVEIRI